MSDTSDAPREIPSYDPPAGYKDEAEFLKEGRERFQEGVDFDRENRDEAQQDLRTFAGEIWTAEDIKARAGRPCLTINPLPQFVAQVTGDIRINRPAIKVRPAKDATQDLADVREGLIRSIEYRSGALTVYADTGQAQVACGIGNFRVALDYQSDDAFERDLFIRPIPNPFAVVWDPMITDKTGRDARYAFVVDEMPRKVYERPVRLGHAGRTRPSARAPRLADARHGAGDGILAGQGTPGPDRSAAGRVGQGADQVQHRAELTPLIAKNGRGEPMVRNTTRRSVCMYLISGQKILEKPVEYNLSPHPAVPRRRLGGEHRRQDHPVRPGALCPRPDQAEELLALRLGGSPGPGPAPAMADPRKPDRRSGGVRDGRQVRLDGAEVGRSIKPERLEPPPINAAVLQEAALNAQDIKDVTGLHDASLGARSNETSGKAILARQREGDVATYIYQDNLKAAIAEAGKVLDEWIPQVYDTAREIPILGADETQRIMRVNDPGDPDSVNLAQGKYDIVVETGPSFSTKRVEAAESMMQFVQAVPLAGQVAGDLIAKAQDWPMSDEIGERLQNALPPGVIKPDPAKMSPEEQQQYAQQQQQAQVAAQMQQQGAQLNLAELDAKVMKTRAEANAPNAEAQRLGTGEAAHPEDQGIRAADLRIANANAVKAEAEAGIALFNLQTLTRSPSTAESEAISAAAAAHSAVVKAASDTHDLMTKPLDTAHQLADLNTKLNPPDPQAPQTQAAE
jgi:hypothetical protein